MFHIQSTKTKLFVSGSYSGNTSWINDINRAIVFNTPQEAQNYIDNWCSVTSRSHVVYFDNSAQLWNVIKQGLKI